MNPLQIPAPSEEQFTALETLYQTTCDVRLRTRAQMILLVVEKPTGGATKVYLESVMNIFLIHLGYGKKTVPQRCQR